MIGRVLIGASGVAVMAYGIDRLLTETRIPHPVQVGEWLLGAVILHDLVIAPFVLAVGFIVSKTVPSVARGIVQGALVVVGPVLVIAIPLLVKPVPSIPTVLPLDYAHSLTIVLSSVAAVMVLLILLRLMRRGGSGRTGRTERSGPREQAREQAHHGGRGRRGTRRKEA